MQFQVFERKLSCIWGVEIKSHKVSYFSMVIVEHVPLFGKLYWFISPPFSSLVLQYKVDNFLCLTKHQIKSQRTECLHIMLLNCGFL